MDFSTEELSVLQHFKLKHYHNYIPVDAIIAEVGGVAPRAFGTLPVDALLYLSCTLQTLHGNTDRRAGNA